MVLCNLGEAHLKFNAENPAHSVGFSKFCYLRPEECVLAGQNGTHSICSIHQNFKLKFEAIKPAMSADLTKYDVFLYDSLCQ
jgi:hypothetical protein